MGLFDTIYCKVPLPGGTPFNEETDFQTKSFPDPFMETYVIEADGSLMKRGGYYEPVPENERPYPDGKGLMQFIGCIRFVETGWQRVIVHQYVDFYTCTKEKWYEFRATFTHGVMDCLELFKVEDMPQRQPDVDPSWDDDDGEDSLPYFVD